MWLFCNLFQESLLSLNSRDWNFCHILTLRYWPQFNLDNEWQLARKQLVLPLLGVLFLYCLICRTGINMTEIALTTSKSSPHNYICIMPLIIATVPQEQTILVLLWNLWLCASIHLSYVQQHSWGCESYWKQFLPLYHVYHGSFDGKVNQVCSGKDTNCKKSALLT